MHLCMMTNHLNLCKVEKILKGTLALIPSPSMKIQIMGGKVCLRCKGKTLLGIAFKSLLILPSNVLPHYLNNNFPTNNLNFHCDEIEPRLSIISELGGVI